MISDYPTALGVAALVILLSAIAHPRVRRALADGARCLARYPDSRRLVTSFGFAYGLFQLAATVLLLHRAGDNLAAWAIFIDFAPPQSLAPAWRPAFDTTTSTFHFLTLTFPLSTLFALRILLNVGGVFRELRRALGSWLIALLSLTALAALAKPFAFLFLPEFADLIPHSRIFLFADIVNLAATIFELSVGVFLVTYLSLIARLWLRGSHLNHRSLVHFTAHRIRFVARWAVPAIGLAYALILFPRFAVRNSILPEAFANDWTPWFYAVLLLLTISTPVTLTLRNLTLGAALSASRDFLLRNPIAVTLFLALGFAANLILATSAGIVARSFGPESILTLGGHCILFALQSALAGWLVVSWTLLYKSLNSLPSTSP